MPASALPCGAAGPVWSVVVELLSAALLRPFTFLVLSCMTPLGSPRQALISAEWKPGCWKNTNTVPSCFFVLFFLIFFCCLPLGRARTDSRWVASPPALNWREPDCHGSSRNRQPDPSSIGPVAAFLGNPARRLRPMCGRPRRLVVLERASSSAFRGCRRQTPHRRQQKRRVADVQR